MLVSKEKERFVEIDIEKVASGSFFTTETAWLNQPVRDFLEMALRETGGKVLDPFAGNGHLLETLQSDATLRQLVKDTFGLDIAGPWPKNDSLLGIPNPEKSLILTNPPYLANHSAKRKGVDSMVQPYFQKTGMDNLYKIALANSLAAAEFVVAIVPETFLLSNFPKDRLEIAVVIEDSLFGDTEAPTLVACFGRNSDKEVFLGEQRIGTLDELLALRKPKVKKHKVIFNVPNGRIGLRAVDGADGKSPIAFMKAADFFYPSSKVRVSSRLMTYLEIPGLKDSEIDSVIEIANFELAKLRDETRDLILAPFKGNDLAGKRRRRLDYALARSLLSISIEQRNSLQA